MNAFQKFLYQLRHHNKKVYFVRHGETILNAQRIRQGRDGGLSELGKKQAEATGERLKNFPIDVIISSPFERTKETTAIINKHLNKPVEYSELLAERRNPSEIIGKWYDDPEVRKIIDRIDKSFHEGSLRYSDEENYEDLRERARQLFEFLAARPEKNILCVTHGIFLTLAIAYMEYRDKLTPQDYISIAFHNPASNAGITVCEYDERHPNTESKGWTLLAWNDYNRGVK
jgi:broad specificity phosphatase PhoE